MSFPDRLGWFILGCLIGFALGYILRTLQDIREDVSTIKEEVDEVDKIVKNDRGELGFIRNAVVNDIALFIIIIITVWAAFSSQKATNDAHGATAQIGQVSYCNQQYLSKTIKALNERTTFTRDQATANVGLQRAQADMLGILLAKPPPAAATSAAAVQRYFAALTKFVTVSGKTDQKAESNPYPTNTEFLDCVNNNK